MAVPEALTHKIGPWPLWGWAAVGAAGVGGGLLLRRTALFGGGAKVTPADTAAATGAGYLAGPTIVPAGGAVALPNYGTGTGVPAGPTTNTEWARSAVGWLITQRVNPTLADAAVRKYIEGLPLDDAEARAVDMALAGTPGVPPEGVPPVNAPPTQPPIPPPVPPPAPTGPIQFAPPQIAPDGSWVRWTWTPPAGTSFFTVYPERVKPDPRVAMGIRSQTAATWTWYSTFPGAVVSIGVVAYDGRENEISRGWSTVAVP